MLVVVMFIDLTERTGPTKLQKVKSEFQALSKVDLFDIILNF